MDCEILNEYKELIGLNDKALKSASSALCTVSVEYTVNKYYYAVYVGSTFVKFAYNYSEIIYDVDYYCTGGYSDTSGGGTTGGGGTSSGGDDDEGFDDFETENQEQEAKEEICNTYNGIIDINSLENQAPNFSPQQEQFIISLANVAALYELGFSLDGIQTDLVNYRANSVLYTKLNKLNNPENYIINWAPSFNSSTLSYDANISSEIGNSGFHLKFYSEKNGESNAIGLIKDGFEEHLLESALELLEYIDVKYMGFPDDYLYDMHLFNALNFMDYYCYE